MDKTESYKILCNILYNGIKEKLDAMRSVGFALMYLDGKVIDLATIESLAKLPTRDVLLATVCNVFNAPIAAFARAVQAIADKNGEAAAE